MKRHCRVLLLVFCGLSVSVCGAAGEEAPEAPLRVVVVGGLALSGVWPELEAAAEEALGFHIDTVMAAPKESIVPAFMAGEADLMLIHGGDETFALQALGYAEPAPTWAYNEFAIVGPTDDPAGVAASTSGADAMRRIHLAQAPVIAFRDPGSFAILQRLLETAGLTPGQLQLIGDTMPRPQQILALADQEQAYVLVGRIPAAKGRMASPGVTLLYTGDPAMRRAYVIVVPGSLHSASALAREQARRLMAYLLSAPGQEQLLDQGPEPGVPWLFPRATAVVPTP